MRSLQNRVRKKGVKAQKKITEERTIFQNSASFQDESIPLDNRPEDIEDDDEVFIISEDESDHGVS